MSNTVIDAKSTIFSKLFYTGKLEVPWHQRRYDWRKEQVSELLHDIGEAIKEGRKCYFLGTIMLVQKGKRKQRWEINDGQQRMVTFSLICARLSCIFHEGNVQRHEGHALRVLFCLDENHTKRLSEADELEPRLTPPRNDKARYNLLVRGKAIGTNGKLTEAWQLIDQFISSMELKECKKFMDFLLNKVEVACLYIPKAVDPNSVFETINCRGKRLDDLDLIRNYLYSYFNAEEQKPQRKTVYHNLESVREYLKYDKKATEYARCYFQCKYGFLRKDRFYRETRNKIRSMVGSISTKNKKSVGYIYDLVSEFSLSERVELFKVITNPSITDTDSDTDSFIQGFQIQSSTNNKARNLLIFLKELQTYKITQPIVFALLNCYIKETDGRKKKPLAKHIHTNLKHVTSFVMRTAFVAPKFVPSLFEREFSNLAKNILSAESLYDIKIMDVLKGCDSTYGIINDDRFVEKMKVVEMRDAKKIKRFLLGVNDSVQTDSSLINEGNCSVEHILPQAESYWPSWKGFSKQNPRDWIHRIGNLTLLGQEDNKSGKKENSSFSEKKNYFKRSSIALTRKLHNKYENWSPKTIAARQIKLAKQAADVWSF